MNRKNNLPHFETLALLRPLPPPAKVLALCRQHQNISSLNITTIANEQNQTDRDEYRKLYQQKCEQDKILKDKCKMNEQIISTLLAKNNKLEREVVKLQEDRWNRSDYLGQTSARPRSKSQKALVPTIQVKVPNHLKQKEKYSPTKNIENQSSNPIHFQYKQELQGYKEKLQQYKQEFQQNKQELQQNKQKVDNLAKEVNIWKNKYHQLEMAHKSTGIQNAPNQLLQTRNIFTKQLSPQNIGQNWWMDEQNKSPQITDFSPQQTDIRGVETVKKQTNQTSAEVQREIKRLKNQIMYKNLLIDSIKAQHQKQHGVLKRHLHLSVHESKRIAEETTAILNSFKNQMIQMKRELDGQRSKRLKQQLELNRLRTEGSQRQFVAQKSQADSLQNVELLDMLKTRRTEKLAN